MSSTSGAAARAEVAPRIARLDAQDRLAALASLAPRVTTGPLAAERSLEVLPVLRSVLPSGLPRGSTVLSTGSAALSTALALVAGASQAGAWAAVAGLPALGLRACAEAGVALERLVAVHGRVADELWGQVLGVMVDGFDVVVAGAASRVRPGTARRVQSRLAHRGAVLVLVGSAGPFSADVVVESRTRWEGLGTGHGHLAARRVALRVDGRRVRRERRMHLWLPSAAGTIAPADGGPSAEEPASWQQTG